MLRTDFGLPRSQPQKITDHGRNNWPILRWDQLAFWWFMLERQEQTGQVAHLAGRKPIFATNYTNVIQIIVLDYIRLIGRQNWITFGPNECGGKEGSYTIKKPFAKGVAAPAVAAVRSSATAAAAAGTAAAAAAVAAVRPTVRSRRRLIFFSRTQVF